MHLIRIVAAIGILLVLAAGCGKPERYPLAVGIDPWVGNDPLVLARERGLVDVGRIKIVELGSSNQVLRNLANGLLDAAVLTLDEALRLADEGGAIRIVALLDISTGGDALVVRPEITTLAQLKDKRLSIDERGVDALILARLLEAANLTREDVSLQPIEPVRQESALRAGWIDGIVTFEPAKSRLEAAGFRVLFDSSRMSGEIVNVLVVRASVLELRADDVVELLVGWERGLLALRSAPVAAAGVLAAGALLTPQNYLDSLRGVKFAAIAGSAQLQAGDPPAFAERHGALAQRLLDLGLIRSPPAWSELLTGEPAAMAVQRLEREQ